ncbi:MAG: PEGA domain-containing protein [Polyangiaceae bacterium]|nr:PEGA domain-containing protein [Polyangiaceae bacterium]
MGQSFDSDRPRNVGHDSRVSRLPPVAPPPRKITSSTPDTNGYHGHSNGSGAYGGSFGPLPPVSTPPMAPGRGLPPVSAPPVSTPPLSARPSPRITPPAVSRRDPLADSITRVKTDANAPDTLPERSSRGRFDDVATNPNGSRRALDWDEEEESTHVFHSSMPPPRDALAAPMSNGHAYAHPSSHPHAMGYEGDAYAHASVAVDMQAPPGTDTLRLDTPGSSPNAIAAQTLQSSQPFASSSSSVPPRGHGHSGLSPMFPPPPPIPSITQARPIEPLVAGISAAVPIGPAQEVIRDNQPFTKLPQGNPGSATELGIRKPTLPSSYVPPQLLVPSALPGYAPVITERRDSKRWILAVAALAALVSLGALVTFLFTSRPGGLQVEVKDASGASVPKASVYIDGRKVCDATPCSVRDLQVGRYAVRVMTSDEDALEPLNVEVKAGAITPVTFTVNPEHGTLVASTEQPDVHLFVDGTDRGSLPVKLADIAPGKRQLKLGGKRYRAFEKSVDIKAGETLEIDVPKLAVTNGVAKVVVKSSGVTVTLVRTDGSEPGRIYDVAAARPIEVDTTVSWKLVAKKKGFADIVEPLTFPDGQPERTVTIDFKDDKTEEPAVVASATPPTVAATTGRSTPTPGRTPDPKPDPPANDPPAAQPSGNGFLNINSIPASRVLLDGQPLGETPKTGVSVSAGTHTVTFIHPELGKKSLSVKVGPGETKTASAKLR